jgi:hypothetical protein
MKTWPKRRALAGGLTTGAVRCMRHEEMVRSGAIQRGEVMSISRRFGSSFLNFVILGGIAFAQQQPESDLVDEAKRMERVAAQKVENDLRQTLVSAERIAKTNPAKAIDRLALAISQIDEDKALSAERHAALKRLFKDRIRVFESDLYGTSDKEKAVAKIEKQQGDNARKTSEEKKIASKIKEVNQLEQQGKTEEAATQASKLAEKHPDVTAAQASDQTATANDRVTQAKKALKEREKGTLLASRDIQRSSILPGGDLEFPKDWKERTKNRTATVKLSEKEKSILKSLASPISVNFKNSKLEDVLEYLRTYTGQNIIIDTEALKDAEASYDTPITLKANNLSVRTVLRKVLADVGLTYIIKDETIRATSIQTAKDTMVVRAYYIGDIVANWGLLNGLGSGNTPLPHANPIQQAPPAVVGFGALGGGVQVAPAPAVPAVPQVQAAQNMQYVKAIMEMVENSVDSNSWRINGGNGTISFHAASMSLLIKQSAEVHAMLGGSGVLR